MVGLVFLVGSMASGEVVDTPHLIGNYLCLACQTALWIYGLDGLNYDDSDDFCKWANLQIEYPLPLSPSIQDQNSKSNSEM